MRNRARDLARALADQAERVCRTYLSNGRKVGSYWCVGDVNNTPGSSLFVRLVGPASGPGASGKWTDAATGQHGDLLDLLGHALHLPHMSEQLNEAERFLGTEGSARANAPSSCPDRMNAVHAILRQTQPLAGTPAEVYLRNRGLSMQPWPVALRFHPRCRYKAPGEDGSPALTTPALVASVTTKDAAVTGLQRTWIDATTSTKSLLPQPRRSLGAIRANGVRMGQPAPIVIVGEGLETTLSVLTLFPSLAAVAALSASNLPLVDLPASADTVLVAVDRDRAGLSAARALIGRLHARGVAACALRPRLKDFNDDLVAFGRDQLRQDILRQVDAYAAERLLAP